MTGRFAIIPIPDGPAPPEAIVVGDLDAVLRYLPQTVAAEELEARALGLVDQLDRRERALSDGARALTQSVGKFMDACGRLVDGEEEREAEQIRQDEEEKARAEAAEIETYLAEHPEPSTEPKAMPDDGELEIHEPSDKERYGGLEIEEDAGGVPLSYGNVPETYVRREAAEGLGEPGIGGASYPEPDPEDLSGPPKEKQVPQRFRLRFGEED
jgi:hypothetical protein